MAEQEDAKGCVSWLDPGHCRHQLILAERRIRLARCQSKHHHRPQQGYLPKHSISPQLSGQLTGLPMFRFYKVPCREMSEQFESMAIFESTCGALNCSSALGDFAIDGFR